jgi:Leucine-rich repeat (LRR) protein
MSTAISMTMSDSSVLKALEEKVGRPFLHLVQDNRCVELSLCDDGDLFYGLVRHHSPAAKLEILRLISQLPCLRKLNLRRNLLRVLPHDFAGLTQLEELNLGSNYLGAFPEQIRGFENLKSLALGNNDITELPSWCGELQNLEYLALHKNIKLRSITPLKGMLRLRSLNLYFVNLHTLPEFVYEFRDMKNLVLWNIKNFPDGLETLENLEFFTNCGGPSVRELPKGFTRLEKLRMARVYQNDLETLPEDLGDLQNLEQLSVYQNRLSQLPDSMARLRRLTKLNLGWNCFESLPDWLNNLTELQWIGIFENPLKKRETLRTRAGLKIDREWPFTTIPVKAATA